MTWLSRASHVVHNLICRDRVERELDAEMHAYVDLLAEEKMRAGLSADAAAYAAILEAGRPEQVKEEVRDVLAGASIELVARDARYGWRSLRRNPGFAVAAVLALALGIGATTAILSVVNSVLLRPLSYGDPDRLVVLSAGGGPVAPAIFVDWRAQSRSFSEVAAAEYWTPILSGGDAPESITALHLTSRMLPMLGVRPILGRFFSDAEDEPGRNHVAVIAHGLWQRRFASDSSVIGRRVSLDGVQYTIIGVMPPEFLFAPFWATRAELWAPLSLGARVADRGGSSLRVFARLRPGASLAQARDDMARVAAQIEQQFPGSNRGVTVTPLMELVVGNVRTPLLILLVAVGLVLLIACANVAHMLLARAAARSREIAVRCALGASRGQVTRQLLIESLMLAAIGGAAGLLLADWGLHALVAASPDFLPRVATVRLDARVLVVTALITGATAVLFGLLPALRASAIDLAQAFRQGDRGAASARGRLRAILVASEITLALVLLVGAGLLARSFLALRRVDTGFDPRGVITMKLSVAGTRVAEPGSRAAFYREVLERVRALPGVSAAGLINHVPIVGDSWGVSFAVEGRATPHRGEAPSARYRVVTPGYFAAMRIPLRRGRDLSDFDREGAPAVVIVNEQFANTIWPGRDPIGQRITLDDSTWVTVVGVSKNVVSNGVAAATESELYLPLSQDAGYLRDMQMHHLTFSLVARARCDEGLACDAAALVGPIAGIVRSIDRNVAIAQPIAMTRALDSSTADTRFYLVLLAVFAAIAVTLAGLGIFGVTHYLVARRTREIGIRVALGAEPSRVVRLVVGEAVRVAALGAGGGLVGALLLGRLMGRMLYGVGTSDVVTFTSMPALLLAVAALASWIPARRAARIDPLRALRSD